MTRPDNDPRPGELSDAELNAVLSAADEELLDYVRRATDPPATPRAVTAPDEEAAARTLADVGSHAAQDRRSQAGQAADRPGETSLFISYARDDASYAMRLAEHLRDHGLPVWLDAELTWGSRFSQGIGARLASAAAMIVIMSPASESAEWVEREVLEAMRHDRAIMPVLLAGERHFLLASTGYFDARQSELPGESVIRKLRALVAAQTTGLALSPPSLPRPSAARAAEMPIDDVLSEIHVCLAEGRTAHADQLTTPLLLQAARRLNDGWLRRTDGERLPSDLLNEIDAAWSTFSQGTQGFRAQLSRHRSPSRGIHAGGPRDFYELGKSVGWLTTQGTAPRYSKLVSSPHHQTGLFPTLRNQPLEQYADWRDKWKQTVMAVHLQIRRWTEQ